MVYPHGYRTSSRFYSAYVSYEESAFAVAVPKITIWHPYSCAAAVGAARANEYFGYVASVHSDWEFYNVYAPTGGFLANDYSGSG